MTKKNSFLSTVITSESSDYIKAMSDIDSGLVANHRQVKDGNRVADRRKNILKIISFLDRRSIQDRRLIKDCLTNKGASIIGFSAITEQGVSITSLINEQKKAIKVVNTLILFYGTTSELVKEFEHLYYAISAQLSKEKLLQQWYLETLKGKNDKSGESLLKLNNILILSTKGILQELEKYKSISQNETNAESLLVDMVHIRETLDDNLTIKEDHIYKHFKQSLML